MLPRMILAAILFSLASLGLAADSALIEDFSSFPYLWKHSPNVTLDNPAIPVGDPLALPGQQALERILSVTGPQRVSVEIAAHACRVGHGVVIAVLLSTPDFDAGEADPRTITLGGAHAFRWEHRGHGPKTRLGDVDRDGDLDLVLFFHGYEACAAGDDDPAFNGRTYDGRWFTAGGADARFDRPFAASTDWSLSDGLKLWYYGQGSGDTIRVQLRDNRVPDPGPSGWRLVWKEEFDGPAGRSPDPARWTPEIGDGTANGIPGWGNNEREYYTDRAENAALDGQGHLVISAAKADGSLSCYYGPCEYTSARLKTQDKVEIGHGRIEARIKVPSGAGLWPAFWALGSDIGKVGWPASGEIDIMEYVGRKPNEVSGVLHGPGYSGGSGIGGQIQLPAPVADDYHVFAIEWQRGRIDWLVDGVRFHSVTTADLAGKQWVFDKPFFMILNLAVGGWLGGEVGSDVTFPRTLTVDYIRVFQAPDTAERFESGFVDGFTGWQEVALPFTGFSRSDRQPEGAPNDGLTLREVWGYGFRLPDDGVSANPLRLDKVRLIKPASVVVRNLDDQGRGSLREAVAAVADGGSVSFDPALAGGAITLASGPLWVSGKALTVDGSAAAGLTLRGAGGDRLLIVDPAAKATLRSLTLADGFGWDLAGGILTNGGLDLDHVVVRNNTVIASGGDWWKGGGGIYVGGGATLNLKDSTVRDNRTVFVSGGSGSLDGGGIYTFQGSTMHVEHDQRQRRGERRRRDPHARQRLDRRQHDQRQHRRGLVWQRGLPHGRRAGPAELDGGGQPRSVLGGRRALRGHLHAGERHPQPDEHDRGGQPGLRLLRRALGRRHRGPRLRRPQRVLGRELQSRSDGPGGRERRPRSPRRQRGTDGHPGPAAGIARDRRGRPRRLSGGRSARGGEAAGAGVRRGSRRAGAVVRRNGGGSVDSLGLPGGCPASRPCRAALAILAPRASKVRPAASKRAE